MDFLVYHMEQKLFVDVYDSDLLSKDDLLGYVCADAETLTAKDHGKEAPRRPRISDLDENEETWFRTCPANEQTSNNESWGRLQEFTLSWHIWHCPGFIVEHNQSAETEHGSLEWSLDGSTNQP
jgi:hypothetical protein